MTIRPTASLLPVLALAGAAFLATPAAAQDATEALLRIDRLETENRRLNGEVERMQFQIRRLEEQFRKLQEDANARLEALEGEDGAPRAEARRPRAERPDEPEPRAADEPGAETPEDTVGNLAAQDPERPATDAPAGTGRSVAAARRLLEDGRFAQAEAAFRTFLEENPDHPETAEAAFGLGESLFQRERYTDAAEHYLDVSSRFPRSPRAPEAMLKLGMSLARLGARTEACSTFSEIGKKYPRADGDVRQAVERQRKAAKCG
jgi:tol-pal system protein YbgF